VAFQQKFSFVSNGTVVKSTKNYFNFEMTLSTTQYTQQVMQVYLDIYKHDMITTYL